MTWGWHSPLNMAWKYGERAARTSRWAGTNVIPERSLDLSEWVWSWSFNSRCWFVDYCEGFVQELMSSQNEAWISRNGFEVVKMVVNLSIESRRWFVCYFVGIVQAGTNVISEQSMVLWNELILSGCFCLLFLPQSWNNDWAQNIYKFFCTLTLGIAYSYT